MSSLDIHYHLFIICPKMKSKLLIFELNSNNDDDGPVWIGYGFFSTGSKSVYFDGKALSHTGETESKGNYIDILTEEEYRVSEVKKTGTERLNKPKRKIYIEEKAIKEFLTLNDLPLLPGEFIVYSPIDSQQIISLLNTFNDSIPEE